MISFFFFLSFLNFLLFSSPTVSGPTLENNHCRKHIQERQNSDTVACSKSWHWLFKITITVRLSLFAFLRHVYFIITSPTHWHTHTLIHWFPFYIFFSFPSCLSFFYSFLLSVSAHFFPALFLSSWALSHLSMRSCNVYR